VPGDAAAELNIGGVDGATKRASRQRCIAFMRRKPTDGLHALEEGERVLVGEDALFLDNARELVDVGKSAWKAKLGKHGSPFREALRPERCIEKDAAGREQRLETLQAGTRIGKPM